ncbi:hypothetical protein TcasGA2_TC012350 [Tribolium castaneum]|uniref:Uncharacterized protein n=1 Tax=Tribolium castaneum TaxID=7070 RepID=D6X1T6_TRICA|nr:hypothetical protein TcasGA2_TC012350 [Tribolium castaneum]
MSQERDIIAQDVNPELSLNQLHSEQRSKLSRLSCARGNEMFGQVAKNNKSSNFEITREFNNLSAVYRSRNKIFVVSSCYDLTSTKFLTTQLHSYSAKLGSGAKIVFVTAPFQSFDVDNGIRCSTESINGLQTKHLRINAFSFNFKINCRQDFTARVKILHTFETSPIVGRRVSFRIRAASVLWKSSTATERPRRLNSMNNVGYVLPH